MTYEDDAHEDRVEGVEEGCEAEGDEDFPGCDNVSAGDFDT